MHKTVILQYNIIKPKIIQLKYRNASMFDKYIIFILDLFHFGIDLYYTVKSVDVAYC